MKGLRLHQTLSVQVDGLLTVVTNLHLKLPADRQTTPVASFSPPVDKFETYIEKGGEKETVSGE